MTEKVTIFTTPRCPYCQAAKDDFAQKGIEYEEVDVSSSPEALRRMLELTGGERAVPVIVSEGKVSIGFGGA